MVSFPNLPTIGASQVTNAGTTSNDADAALVNALASPRAETIDNSNAFTITNAASDYLWERNISWRFTDDASAPTAQITVTVPASPARGLFGIINATGQDMAIEISGQPLTAPVLNAGEAGLFASDGTNVELLSSGAAGDFLSLSDTPSSFAGQDGKVVAVNAGGTALEFTDAASSAGDALPFTLSPRWRGARVVLSADDTGIDATAGYNIPWDAEEEDTDAIHDTVTNNTRLTVPAGITRITLHCMVRLTNITSGVYAVLLFQKNGGNFYGMGQTRQEVTDTTIDLTIVAIDIPVVPGDYFEARLAVETDTSVDIDSTRSSFTITVAETTDTVPSLRTVVLPLASRRRFCRLSKSSNQSIVNSTITQVTFDGVDRDTDNMADTVNDQIVIPQGARLITINAGTDWATSATGARQTWVTIDGANYNGQPASTHDGAASFDTNQNIVALNIPVSGGETVEMKVRQTSGGALDLTGNNYTFLEVEVVEWATSTDAPVAYIAVPPEHKGVAIKNSGTQSIPDATPTIVTAWDTVVDGGNSFDPDDGGPPQRFWLGTDQTFVDGDVDTGNDNVNVTGHGFETGEGPFTLTNSGGALPTGLATATKYWAIRDDADNLGFATSRANALAGTHVGITAAGGGGTHTIETADKLVIPAGIAKVQLKVSNQWLTATSGVRFFSRIAEGIAKTTLDQFTATTGQDTFPSAMAESAEISVSEGDFFRAECSQDSSAALDLVSSWGNLFSITVVEESRAITYPGVTVTPPHRGVRAKRATQQTGADYRNAGAGAVIPWDGEDRDTDAFHDNATNPSRITIPIGLGVTKVKFECQLVMANLTAGEYTQAVLIKNGTVAHIPGGVGMQLELDASQNNYYHLSSDEIDVSDGDYFEIWLRTEADTSIDITTDSYFAMSVVEFDTYAFPPEEIHFFQHGAPAVSDVLFVKVFNRRTTINDALAGTEAYALGGANGGSVVYDIKRNGTKIGDITFADTTGAAAAHSALSTIASQQYVFDVGDYLTIESPASVQAMTNITFNISGFRT